MPDRSLNEWDDESLDGGDNVMFLLYGVVFVMMMMTMIRVVNSVDT